MNRQRTHTVERSWRTEDRTTGEVKNWVLVRGFSFPMLSDEPCPEGSAVVVANDRAERPQ